MLATWASLGCVGFRGPLDGHSAKLDLVREHVLELRECPLMQTLVHPAAVVDPLSDSCEVTNYNCSYPSLVEDIYQSRCDLVQEVFDLVADLF
jgi:hypothetical protein